MTITRARVSLVAVFLASLVVQIIAAIYVFTKKRIYDDELQSVVTKLLAIYSVHFAVIVGGVFGQHRGLSRRFSPFAYWLALVLSCAWNFLLLWRSLVFGFAKMGAVNQFLSYLDAVSSAGSFLVAGTLAFFFTNTIIGKSRP